MTLICPKWESERIIYAGITQGIGEEYKATDARYTCKDCGYTNPLIVEVEKEEAGVISPEKKEKLKLPIFWIFILAIFTLLAIAWGEDILVAILVFLIFSSILSIFFYFIREDEFEPIEKDLEKLDEEGKLK